MSHYHFLASYDATLDANVVVRPGDRVVIRESRANKACAFIRNLPSPLGAVFDVSDGRTDVFYIYANRDLECAG